MENTPGHDADPFDVDLVYAITKFLHETGMTAEKMGLDIDEDGMFIVAILDPSYRRLPRAHTKEKILDFINSYNGPRPNTW